MRFALVPFAATIDEVTPLLVAFVSAKFKLAFVRRGGLGSSPSTVLSQLHSRLHEYLEKKALPLQLMEQAPQRLEWVRTGDSL